MWTSVSPCREAGAASVSFADVVVIGGAAAVEKAAKDAGETVTAGPGRYRSPRHRTPYNPWTEGSDCGSMAWRAERNASACMRRHQAFALVPVLPPVRVDDVASSIW